jgi:hypothetical protein
MFQTTAVDKIKTHFTFNNFFSFKNGALHEIMWKKKWYSRTGYSGQYKAAHSHCMPGK